MYFGITLLTEPLDSSIPIIKDENTINNITSKINVIYKQIKKNEIRPDTDYLFNNSITNNNKDLQNEYFKKRLERTNLINKRSKINYFGFHITNPLLKILRNFFLKRLVKNKNFIQSYLGKIYK